MGSGQAIGRAAARDGWGRAGSFAATDSGHGASVASSMSLRLLSMISASIAEARIRSNCSIVSTRK
jgi:hypothetical protein